MKSFQAIVIAFAAVLACAAAFAPPSAQVARPAFTTALSMASEESKVEILSGKNSAAIAAVATALAPFAAQA
eukprot:CAMPEP_0178962854 /NCGR_PEP_ID=MMETSP0789-20121207/14632_1 /TAXON_ID=3005 /ORGANISM="Rhizosolenia setigera, Strain CCMP 1694" /LENGTH=71 /DNA_ID=CAMNT_0020647123 /DNA_START=77 /DNA_END=288 /DNA_ORIENTATION=+